MLANRILSFVWNICKDPVFQKSLSVVQSIYDCFGSVGSQGKNLLFDFLWDYQKLPCLLSIIGLQ